SHRLADAWASPRRPPQALQRDSSGLPAGPARGAAGVCALVGASTRTGARGGRGEPADPWRCPAEPRAAGAARGLPWARLVDPARRRWGVRGARLGAGGAARRVEGRDGERACGGLPECGRVTLGARIACGVVRGYQLLLRPLLPAACRFEPSCSEYARSALAEHGVIRGGWLTLRRLARCHPFNPGGYDPPPGAPKGPGERRQSGWRGERSSRPC